MCAISRRAEMRDLMKMYHKHLFLLIIFGLPWGEAAAQPYPAKPIRLVVPVPPGGSNDILSRITAQTMSPGLGQPVVIDNRAGAAGMIGAENVAKSAPDGYSLLNIQASFVANAALRAKMPYDTLNDFVFVGMMARAPLLAVVHPSLPVKNIKELVALARARPGQIHYGTPGIGSHTHLSTELFRRIAGIDIVHVPYKGIAPALTDLMGGHLQLAMTSPPSVMPQVQSGRLKALAVGSAKRSVFLPDIPTIAEAGFANYQADYWWGIAAPAKTPVEIVNRLAMELNKALQSAELKQRYAAEGAEPAVMTREHLTQFIAADIARWRQVARDANVRAE
jgi:tripartite-type tricarboxylate transporter receptor subunit TctC